MQFPPVIEKLADPARRPTGFARGAAVACFLVGFAFLYFFVATQLVNQTNQNRQKSDQQNNITHTRRAMDDMRPDVSEKGFARALWEWFPHYTDGVVNPLWPWLSARFQSETAGDAEVFREGKWINVILTAGFCLGCALVMARAFSLPAAVNATLLIGFGALLPRAVFYQPEPLYFVLFCLCWLVCLATIRSNPLWMYALLGLLAGLAYLAKTSIQPLVLSFALVTTYRFLQDAGCALVGRARWRRPLSQWHWQRHLVGLVFLAVFLLLTAGPRLTYANERFGSPFHSYPSYWMWMDSFPDGVVFMREFTDAEALDAADAADENSLPSPGNWFAAHSPDQALARLAEGFYWTVENLVDPPRAKRSDGRLEWRTLLPGRGWYLGALAGLLLGLLAWHCLRRPRPENAAHRLPPEASTQALFVVGCALCYALAYGWYVPIGKGDRFLLSLFVPLVLTLVWAAEAVLRRIRMRGGRPWAWLAYQSAHLVVFATLVHRLTTLYLSPYFYEK